MVEYTHTHIFEIDTSRAKFSDTKLWTGLTQKATGV